MALIKGGALAEDHFQTVAEDAPLPANGAIVSLARFQKDRESALRPQRAARREAAIVRVAGGFG